MVIMVQHFRKYIVKVFIGLISVSFVSCTSQIEVSLSKNEISAPKIDTAPVTSDLTPSDWYKDVEAMITLDYTDTDSDNATNCNISGLSNLTETTACSCSSGVCTVGVTGTSNYTGGVSFNYTVTANSVTSNQSTVNFSLNNLGASGSEEWVRIPADTGSMGLSEFYVMKYEAKAWSDGNANSTIDIAEVDTDGQGVVMGTHMPVSIESNQPWRDINANDAAAKCESLGSNFHLISNPEWLAIARDIENVDTNWTGGTVGTGCLFRGNSGDSTCGYYSATDPDSGAGRNSRAKHTLSTGEEIFDISGNMYEWTDWDSEAVGFQVGPTTCGATITQLPDVICGALASIDFDTDNGTYTSTEGVGVLFSDSGGAATRGGSWSSGGLAGAFTLSLVLSPVDAGDFIGFRCVFRP